MTGMEKATFTEECFSGVESSFGGVSGLMDQVLGHAGGSCENPAHKQVWRETGPVELVQVVYDPAKVNYDHLLDVFFANHGPTTLNRQRADYGSPSHSVVFPHTPDQQRLAPAKVEALSKTG